MIILRYFNPVGAHSSGTLGEDPNGIPNNLMPYVSQVAVGNRPCLNVFGNDYNTIDGTGVRDYLHIMDLAEGHVSALQKLLKADENGAIAINLGTGNGYSVLQVIYYIYFLLFKYSTNILYKIYIFAKSSLLLYTFLLKIVLCL